MTPHELWTALPQDARERVDALVVRRRHVLAIKEMRESGAVPRPGLRDCADLVAARMEILADRLGVPPRGPGDGGPPDVRAE
ncbi:hypothetical protein [Streptomyces sp. NPDC088757]|uniref:hypothetical protein n=1 Tax=Streptomyces sp. NPDC088757 TaxID=3365889 RepID=UPI0037F82150